MANNTTNRKHVKLSEVDTTMSGYSLDLDLIQSKIDKWLEYSREKKAYSVTRLMLSLDVLDRSTFALWQRGYTSQADMENKGKKHNKALSHMIKKAKFEVLGFYEENGNSQRTAKDIFLMKNWFNFVDRKEQKVDVNANIAFKIGKKGAKLSK